MSSAYESFAKFCVMGLEARKDNIKRHLEDSLMTVTALTPKLGYDRAVQVAMTAFEKNISLREAVIILGLLSAEEFDDAVKFERMLGYKR